ncbi:MAG: alpha/beta hydrolase [Salinimicrobium sp.]
MKKICCILFFQLFLLTASAQDYGNNPEAGGYIPLNGINMYYESYGSGEPLLLLHGNGGSIKGHKQKIDFFKDKFRVIVMDSRGHGKTTGNNGKPLTYDQMAEDLNVLMDSLQVEDAYVWGQSDGGILGLLLAINHPEKVKRLATFGANLFPGPTALQEELHELVVQTLSTTKDAKTKQLYALLAYQPDISNEELQQISCPVLIMSGDRDAIKLEHSIRIFRMIPKSNLFIMPGATHFGSYEKPELFNEVLLDFFTAPFVMTSTLEKLAPKKEQHAVENSPAHQ